MGVARAQFGPPKQHVEPSLLSETSVVVAGKPFTVGVLLKMDPGWHVYWTAPGGPGAPPEIAWTLPPGFKAGPISWPLPATHLADDILNFVYEQEVLLPVEITPPATLPAGEVVLKAKVSWLVCEKICIPGSGDLSLKLVVKEAAVPQNEELFAKWRGLLPKTTAPPAVKWDLSDPKKVSVKVEGLTAEQKPEFFPISPTGVEPQAATVTPPDASGAWTITYPLDPAAPAGAKWSGLIVVNKGSAREGWYISPDGPIAPVKAGANTTPGAPGAPSTGGTATFVKGGGETGPAITSKTPSLAGALLLAFLGGLILNVMPCVLPVIALKIFGFVKQAGQDPKRVFHLGLAFVAGVFTFFLAMATIAVVLHASGRSLSWGQQFQNPYLLAGMIALIFVFSLNLLGVFEITLSGGATSTMSELSSKEGFGGAFLHGVFTTLLGTSCTAPLLAISLGYAVTQSAPVIYLLFIAIAVGMSLPYFLLTAVPGWMKYLPKPGAWMEKFKQITGFIMLAVVVWLLSVMVASRPDAVSQVVWYLFVLAIGCWAMGAYQNRVTRWVLFPVAVIAGYFVLLHGPLADTEAPSRGAAAQASLETRITAARETGQPVFVDFTAAWCLNCKVFEKVLKTDKVQGEFKAKNVVTVIADWTQKDREIGEWLKKFNRAGVPLYLLYRPGEEEPVVMDSLTPGNLLAELGKGGK